MAKEESPDLRSEVVTGNETTKGEKTPAQKYRELLDTGDDPHQDFVRQVTLVGAGPSPGPRPVVNDLLALVSAAVGRTGLEPFLDSGAPLPVEEPLGEPTQGDRSDWLRARYLEVFGVEPPADVPRHTLKSVLFGANYGRPLDFLHDLVKMPDGSLGATYRMFNASGSAIDTETAKALAEGVSDADK